MIEPFVSPAKQSKGGATGALAAQTSVDVAGSGTNEESTVSSGSHKHNDFEHSMPGLKAADSASFAANTLAVNPADTGPGKDSLHIDESRHTEKAASATAVTVTTAETTRVVSAEKHDTRETVSAAPSADGQRQPAPTLAPLPAPVPTPIHVAPVPHMPVTATTVEPQFFTLMVRVVSGLNSLCA